MTEDDVAGLIDFLAGDPTAGELIVGTGGCRKVRVAGRGKGKSGGYRTITIYTGQKLPVFLITVFAKGERSNLSKAECGSERQVTMGKRAFDRIAEGLNEALAIARGEAEPAALYIPAEIDVKAIRTKLALSQTDFATLFGFTMNQIRDWEQGRSRPLGGVRAYLMIIERDPSVVLRLLRAVSGRRARGA